MHSATTPLIISAAGMNYDWMYDIRPSVTPIHQLQFRWRNQRQVRKNRRRANAAGKRNAFA